MDTNSSQITAWNNHYKLALLPNTVINIVSLVFGLIGNITVLLVYTMTLKCEQEDRCFIPKLAALDLVAIISSTIIHVSDYFYFVDYPSDTICRTLNFLSCFTSAASAHMLLVIGIQRYMKICTTHSKKITNLRKKAAFIIVLLIALGYSIPVFVASGVREVNWEFKGSNVTGHSCSVLAHTSTIFDNQAYYIALLAILIVNIVATVCVYLPIGRVIYQRSRYSKTFKQNGKGYLNSSGNSSNNSIQEPRKDSQETIISRQALAREVLIQYKQNRLKKLRKCKVNFNMMFLTLVFFYLLSFLPTIVMFLITAKDRYFWFKLPNAELNVLIFLNRLFIVEHAVNPYVYSIFDYKFRDSIRRLLGRKDIN